MSDPSSSKSSSRVKPRPASLILPSSKSAAAAESEPLLPLTSLPSPLSKPGRFTPSRITILSILSCILVAFILLISPSRHSHRSPAYLIRAHSLAAATEAEICSLLAVDIMRNSSGTAVDAAVAATLCIGVVAPYSSGIGGGGFLVHRDARSGKVSALDFRETAPANASKNMFRSNPDDYLRGARSIAVPAELAGLSVAHQLGGKLSWQYLAERAAQVADGWIVTEELELRLRIYGQFMLKRPEMWSDFIDQSTGALKKVGQHISRPALARTLRIVGKNGIDSFYTGELAEQTVKFVQEEGGILSMDDMKDYRVRVQPAIKSAWRGLKLYSHPAPASGQVLFGLLNILEHSPFQLDFAESTHYFIEALKFTLGARTEFCDPPFAVNAQRERMDYLGSKEWASSLKQNISMEHTLSWDQYGAKFQSSPDLGTMSLSIVDDQGSAVSLTSTVNKGFGSELMDPKTGLIFNDQMNDFSIPGLPNIYGFWPSSINFIEGGKRPMSSASPLIVERSDGSLFAVLGGSGGSRILGTVAQVFLNIVNGMDVSAAIEAGRVHAQLLETDVVLESNLPHSLQASLASKKHRTTLSDVNEGLSEVQGIFVDERGTLWGKVFKVPML